MNIENTKNIFNNQLLLRFNRCISISFFINFNFVAFSNDLGKENLDGPKMI